RGEEPVRLARVEHLRVAAEDLADGLRVGQHHEPAVAGDVQREGVAEPAGALVEQPERGARGPDEVPPGRGRGARGGAGPGGRAEGGGPGSWPSRGPPG